MKYKTRFLVLSFFKGLICTIGLPMYNKTRLRGVVATDLSIESVFQEVQDYDSGEGSRAFVIGKLMVKVRKWGAKPTSYNISSPQSSTMLQEVLQTRLDN